MERKMKDSGVEWLGEIPETWEIVRAKNIFTNHKNIVGDKEVEYERLSLTLNGVLKRPKNDSKGLQSESFATYQILNEKELVFKMIDLENVNTSRVGYSQYTGLVSPVYIILNNEKYTRYGYYYFYNMWQRAIFNQLGNNGVRSALNASDMLNLPFLQISHEEAEKIADFLDEKIAEIDVIISNTKNSVEEYRKYKQAVISEVVNRGLDSDVPMKDSGIEWIGKIPTEYSVIKLRYIADIVRGGSPRPAGDLRYYEGNIPFMKISDITKDDGIYVDSCVGSIKEAGLSNTRMVEADSLLLTNSGATLGIPKINTFKTTFNDGIAAFLNLDSKIDIVFAYYALKSKTKYFLEVASMGMGQPNLNTDIIGATHIVIPPLEEQKRIVKFLVKKCEDIDNLIAKKEAFVEEMEAYKKSLIYEYVTGKKEVL